MYAFAFTIVGVFMSHVARKLYQRINKQIEMMGFRTLTLILLLHLLILTVIIKL